jgi:hypothetical protein
MDTDAAARHRSGLWAILSVAPPRLMNGASHAPLTNREDSTREKQFSNAHISYEHAGLVEWGVRVTRAELVKLLPFELAGRARIEGGWCDRMPSVLWAGKHAGHIHRRSQSSSPVFEPRTEARMPLSVGIHFVD